MSERNKIALFSVDKFDGVLKFAKGLTRMGWRILATSETVKYLAKNNIKSQDVSSFVGVTEDYGIPPTLHPKIEKALTGNTCERIDLVYDIPYPLTKGKDVGGLTLLALGCKGNRIVSFCQEDVDLILKELTYDHCHSGVSEKLRQALIEKAYAFIASRYLSLLRCQGSSLYDGFLGRAAYNLQSGENPYQVPASIFSFLADSDPLSICRFEIKSKAKPCFVNIADLDCILNTLCLLAGAFKKRYGKVPFLAIAAKHGNPCGLEINWDNPAKAIEKALMGNPQAIWGGEVIVNFKIDDRIALLLSQSKARKERFGNPFWKLDIIAAAGFTQKALRILSKNPARKILENPALSGHKIRSNFIWHYRQIRGGFLRQPLPNFILNTLKLGCKLNKEMLDNLLVSWAVSWTSNHGGNEVSLVKDRQLIGVGGGPSTLEAAKIAVLRAQWTGHDCRGSTFAANAFFPFVDAPEVLADAGCSYGLCPSGGKNEITVRNFFKQKGIDIIWLPIKFRGFSRH